VSKIGSLVPEYSRLTQTTSNTFIKVKESFDNILTPPSKKATNRLAEADSKTKAKVSRDV
jgi:hypothetical protein